MKLEFPEFGHQSETLVAVVLGALLATLSGVIANQWEAHARQRERERTAALLFGEVLSTLRVLLVMAERASVVPPAWGPVTQRMLQTARREIGIYERNREALVDLRDPALRADVHRLAIQIVMPLDGILDSLKDGGADDDERRQVGFDWLMETSGRIPDLVARLGRIAHHDFAHFAAAAEAAGGPQTTAARAAARTAANAASS